MGLDAILRHLEREGQVILQSPLTFTISALVVATALWWLFQWRTSDRIESLEGRIKLRDDQVANYKAKLSGATPDEAKARLDALERQVMALAPRRLTDDQRRKLKKALTGVRGTIEIAHDVAAADARRLAADFTTVFQEANWTIVSASVMGIGAHPLTGIALQVADTVSLSPLELHLKRAFEEAEIDFDLQLGLQRLSPPPHFSTDIQRPPDLDIGLLLTSRLT